MSRVLELFSGIGGWRLSIPENCSVDETVAYDSGEHCNAIYERNFPHTAVRRRNIEQLTTQELDGFDIWLMSPPCQPFTATKDAMRRDADDKRCKALMHLSTMLPQLERKPMYIALENVKGFYGSRALEEFTSALRAGGYTYKQFLLDPAELGIPNHRQRYYLIAERSHRFDGETGLGKLAPWRDAGSDTTNIVEVDSKDKLRIRSGKEWMRPIVAEVRNTHITCRRTSSDAKTNAFVAMRQKVGTMLASSLELPSEFERSWLESSISVLKGDETSIVIAINGQDTRGLRTVLLAKEEVNPVTTVSAGKAIGDYVDPKTVTPALWFTKHQLEKPFAPGLSYVTRDGHRTFCFTGHYGKVMHKSSGSIFYDDADGKLLNKGDLLAFEGRIRMFSPREILNFFGFPPDFSLPSEEEMPLNRQYKAVGNSICISASSRVLAELIQEEGRV